MSEQRTNVNTRRQGFRRRMRGEKRGVSPVVATLILILIAVAAAAALYLWLVGWQGGVTKSISSPTVNQGTFSIGGSTSVYPFSQLAVTQFEQNFTSTSISLTQGGTGAGMIAVCSGSIDVGEASSVQTVSGLINTDGCPVADTSTITITTVAYDAVDVIVQAANPHGLVSISSDTMLYIYYAQSTTAPVPTINAPTTMNGAALGTIPAAQAIVSAAPGNLGLPWEDIPACVVGATCGGQLQAAAGAADYTATSEDGGAEIAFLGAAGAATSTCGFVVCAGPFASYAANGVAVKGSGGAATDPIVTVQRSDTSGTTQAFTAKVLGFNKGVKPVGTQTGGSASFEALAAASGGCGGDGQLGSCGISATVGENGNPNVISYVAGAPSAIGYASDGLTRAATSGVTCQGVATGPCGIGFESLGQTNAVQPSLGSTGTIAAAISDPSGNGPNALTGEYGPWRPFEYVTLQPPTGLVAEFIAWELQPGVNTALAVEAAEVSVYSI